MYPEKLSVIIPCFNEEAVIRETYKRLKNVLHTNFQSYEMIFINDGSSDTTLTLLEEISESDAAAVVINLSRNFGHQPAVTAGLHNCSGDAAVIIDADLQDPPEVIPAMFEKHREGFDVVYGVRKERKGENFFKLISAKWYYRLINWLSDVHLPLDTGDFRLVSRKVLDAFKGITERRKYIRGIFSWLGFRQAPFEYERDARHAGETKYTLGKMVRFATTGLLYFSKKPLKLSLAVGFICIAIGLLLGIYVVMARLFNPPMAVTSGWASTMIVIIFFGGIQLFTVGVMGEYIGSIFDEIKGRPEYVIESVKRRNAVEAKKTKAVKDK